MVKEKKKPVIEGSGIIESRRDLILFNDEKNTFDFVIQTLVDVCEHNQIQAEQCTLVAHYKGKCPVMSGLFTELKPKSDEMTRRGLTVAID
jgi:ATP-dependent Clp protease adaptor protein ClpS